ncbi:MAG: methylated-DNA--[protein]-cysteine S-methyltransferase [Candidatus Aminicenantes bacterium]|nr:methylated-DNA--[protein]-cysteine S-methyltransferase [Candidatus Aminicenantes bacterium]
MNDGRVLYLDSPLGTIELRGKNGFLTDLNFREKPPGFQEAKIPVLEGWAAQLAEYFAGARTTFEIPLALEGTVFQAEVWEALRTVSFGRTASYVEIARKIGRPSAVRAVGAANGANPVSIIVPCHRIVGADGSLTGYGGGLWRKKWLLEHEKRNSGKPDAPFESPII